MTFHRFLEGQSPQVRMYINGNTQNERVRPWDPFMRSHDATMATPVEILHGGVAVQGYVLPHRDKMSNAEFEAGSGPAGWVSRQGFYVYRGNRLLVTGSWLGLGEGRPWPKDDLHRLARISLDLPNTLDHEWRIDIKKSTARPPVHLRSRLVELAKSVRADARRVFTHRGEVRSDGETRTTFPAWMVSTSTVGARYRIDEAHPVIARILEESGPYAGRIRQMLRVIEETVPVQRIWLDSAETVDKDTPPIDEGVPDDLMELLRDEYRTLKYGGENAPDAYIHACNELLGGLLVHASTVEYLREQSRDLNITREKLKTARSGRNNVMRTLHEIRLFFDRTLGTPVIARELAGKSKEAGWYRHDCSRFTAPAWGKTEKPRELSEEIRGRVHFLASRLTNEETAIRAHFEQLSSILSIRESIKAQRRMEWEALLKLCSTHTRCPSATGPSRYIAKPACRFDPSAPAHHVFSSLDCSVRPPRQPRLPWWMRSSTVLSPIA